MDALTTAAGLALILVALADIWETLLHPTGRGRLSRPVMRLAWRGMRFAAYRRRAVIMFAGPVVFATVIATWFILLVVGWAMVYWYRLPEEFHVSPGLTPDDVSGFVTALYFSIVTISTLGYGEIAPRDAWMRILGPMQALIGFVLLSATITWLLSLYPALARRRALGSQVAALRAAARTETVWDDARTQHLIVDLTKQVLAAKSDLEQFQVIYYFSDQEDDASFLRALLFLSALATYRINSTDASTERFEFLMLQQALGDLARMLNEEFINSRRDETGHILLAYAKEHFIAIEESMWES